MPIYFNNILTLGPRPPVDFWKINLEKSSSTTGLLVYFKLNLYTACVACKNQFGNGFLQVKFQFVDFEFSNLIFQNLNTDQQGESLGL